MLETIIVPLATPVTVGSGDNKKTFSELVFSRKATVRDLEAMDLVNGETKKSCALFASMAGVPITVIQDLELDDFMTVSEKASPLMGKKAAAALKALAAAKTPLS